VDLDVESGTCRHDKEIPHVHMQFLQYFMMVGSMTYMREYSCYVWKMEIDQLEVEVGGEE
jgi:hypothetical protein